MLPKSTLGQRRNRLPCERVLRREHSVTPTAIGVLPMIEAASSFGVDVVTYSSDVSTVKAHDAGGRAW